MASSAAAPDPILLSGLELRYVMIRYLLDKRSMKVRDLVEGMKADGFEIGGRASKTVSDALRAEVVRGRVVRTARGTYAIAQVPSTTERRIRRRAAAIRDGRGCTGPNPILVPIGTSWSDSRESPNWNVF